VQGLHHGNARFSAGRVDRRRDHHEGVMDMDEIRLLVTQYLRAFSLRVIRPDCFPCQHQPLSPRIRGHFRITSAVGHGLMSSALQELALQLKDELFPSPQLLVLIMNQKYFHDWRAFPKIL
jgi:hypothetical protein